MGDPEIAYKQRSMLRKLRSYPGPTHSFTVTTHIREYPKYEDFEEVRYRACNQDDFVVAGSYELGSINKNPHVQMFFQLRDITERPLWIKREKFKKYFKGLIPRTIYKSEITANHPYNYTPAGRYTDKGKNNFLHFGPVDLQLHGLGKKMGYKIEGKGNRIDIKHFLLDSKNKTFHDTFETNVEKFWKTPGVCKKLHEHANSNEIPFKRPELILIRDADNPVQQFDYVAKNVSGRHYVYNGRDFTTYEGEETIIVYSDQFMTALQNISRLLNNKNPITPFQRANWKFVIMFESRLPDFVMHNLSMYDRMQSIDSPTSTIRRQPLVV